MFKVFKIVIKRVKKEITLVNLQKMDRSYTETVEETQVVMVHGLLPDDDLEEDTLEYRELRNQELLYSEEQDIVHFLRRKQRERFRK